MRRAIIVGLTGTTGSGKSTIAEMLKKYGYSVIDCDKVAALVTEKGSDTLKQLAEAFGQDIIYPDDGMLNRELLAERAFASPDRTALLNSITHPEIIRLIMKKVNGMFWDGYEAVIVDAPQLFESKLNEKCNFIIAVTAPEEVCIKRIIGRDKLSIQAARSRMAAQHDEAFFKQNCDVLIENNGDKVQLQEQIRYAARMIEQKISGEEMV